MGTVGQDIRCKRASAAAVVLGILCGAVACSQALAQVPPAGQSRSFRMGFTAFPYEVSAEAVEETRRFVRDNADLIAHHIEGVPWAEALRDTPFPKEVLSDHESKRSIKPPGAKVYLAVSRECFEKPWSR